MSPRAGKCSPDVHPTISVRPCQYEFIYVASGVGQGLSDGKARVREMRGRVVVGVVAVGAAGMPREGGGRQCHVCRKSYIGGIEMAQ